MAWDYSGLTFLAIFAIFTIYRLTHREDSKEHPVATTLDVAGIFPLIGALKYGDEAGALLKNAGKSSDTIKAGYKLWRGKPIIQMGNLEEGWKHIEARHILGNHPTKGAGSLFAPGTTLKQLQDAAETIVDKGVRISKPEKTIQEFVKRIHVNGKSANVKVVVDTFDGKVITMFPLD